MRKLRVVPYLSLVMFLFIPIGSWAQHTEINPQSPVASDGLPVGTFKYSEEASEHGGFTGITKPGSRPEFLFNEAILEGAEEAYETEEEFLEIAASLARFGVGGSKSVIGTDSRVRVTPTTSYPARAVALITFSGGACTGWLYGPDIVATAGHCVHSGGIFGNWYTDFRVYPGRNGRTSPYGFCRAKKIYSVHGWTTLKNEDYDYGAIKLDCTIGNTTGWFGFFWQAASLQGLQATIAGYPGDKPATPLTQWRSSGPIAVNQQRMIFYLHDTFNGQSGAAVYTNRSTCNPCSMAIHNQGNHGIFAPHKNHNHAVRITQEVFDNLLSWRNTP